MTRYCTQDTRQHLEIVRLLRAALQRRELVLQCRDSRQRFFQILLLTCGRARVRWPTELAHARRLAQGPALAHRVSRRGAQGQ